MFYDTLAIYGRAEAVPAIVASWIVAFLGSDTSRTMCPNSQTLYSYYMTQQRKADRHNDLTTAVMISHLNLIYYFELISHSPSSSP